MGQVLIPNLHENRTEAHSAAAHPFNSRRVQRHDRSGVDGSAQPMSKIETRNLHHDTSSFINDKQTDQTINPNEASAESNSNQLVCQPNTAGAEILTNELEEAQFSFPFSTRRPRDLGAGLSSGLKSAAKGLGLGITSLVVAPAYGAIQEGFGGLLKGLGAGVAMAIALPAAGLGIGIAQAARGVINTPEAILERRAGKKWDKEKREWRDRWYTIQSDIEELEKRRGELEELKRKADSRSRATTHTEHKQRKDDQREVVDTYYYDILGVKPDASQVEIRKMYYKLAKECHPDKHPDDPQSSQKFQALGDAYQILADPERRKRYDANGKQATDDMPIVESKMVFAMLFGTEELEPYIGRLRLVTTIESIDSQDALGKLADEISELEQKQREVNLALLLRDRVQPFVNANEEEEKNQWRDSMRDTAKELCKNAFGDAMIEAVGWAYENYASQFLGNLNTFLGLGGRFAKIQAKNREVLNFWRIASTAVRASLATRRLSKINERADKASKEGTKKNDTRKPTTECSTSTPEEQKAREEGAKQLEETLPLLFGTMLEICLIDIQATVRKATKKILKDMSVSLDIQRKRAEAIVELGVIFQNEAENFKKNKKDKKIDVFKHMEDAYIRAAVEADKDATKKNKPVC